jgi:hypothetical protein
MELIASLLMSCAGNTDQYRTANQFGERLFSISFKTYTEKVWSFSCDEISADWAAQRIKGWICGSIRPLRATTNSSNGIDSVSLTDRQRAPV